MMKCYRYGLLGSHSKGALRAEQGSLTCARTCHVMTLLPQYARQGPEGTACLYRCGLWEPGHLHLHLLQGQEA